MLKFFVCIFTALLFLARDGPAHAERRSSSPAVWNSGIFMSLPSVDGEPLEKMAANSVLHDSVLYIAFGYKCYFRSQ